MEAFSNYPIDFTETKIFPEFIKWLSTTKPHMP